MSAALKLVDLQAVRREIAARRLAECWQILSGEYDPLRVVWDEQATQKDRRVLLAMAGCAPSIVGRRISCAWCDLPAVLRTDIGLALRRYSAWAERLE